METDEAIDCVETTFRSVLLRQRLVGALQEAYADSIVRAANYGQWSLARWGVPHDRRGVVDGRLFALARDLPEVGPVLIDNRRRSHTFLGIQIGKVLMVAARTSKPRSLPRRADVRCRLARSPQLSFLERETVGYDASVGDPLLVILGHGPARGIPALLGWARILIPDHRYQASIHTIDLLSKGTDDLSHGQPVMPDVPPVRPRLRQRDDSRELGS